MSRKVKPVVLTTRAIKDLKKIKTFNTKLYGKTKAQEINDVIFERLTILENTEVDFSEIGAIDLAFLHLKYEYRKLIEHYIKITYREGNDKIYVVRAFDTRQHPNKNK